MNSFQITKDSNQELDKVVQASTNIIYLRIIAVALPVMYAVSWMPAIGVVGYWGFLILLIALPIVSIVWWLKYRSVRSDDVFLKKAKRFPLIALAVWGFMLVVWLVFWLVVPAIYLQRQIRNAESQLQNIPEDWRTVIIVRDLNDVYWAFERSFLVRTEKNKVIVKGGAFAATANASATTSASEVGKCFLAMRDRVLMYGSPYQTCYPGEGVGDVIGVYGQEKAIEVKEVALSKINQ